MIRKTFISFITMVKIIKVPLTDLYDRDIFTGKKVIIPESEGRIKHTQKTKKKFEQKIKESTDGYISIEGFGIVKI